MEENFYSQDYKKEKNGINKVLIIVCVVLFLGLAYLYYLHFSTPKDINKPQVVKIEDTKGVSIAYINSDSLWKQYNFILDKQDELAEKERRYQSQYNSKMNAFEKEYNKYIEEGTTGKLSYKEQQAKEEELKQKRDEILQLDQRLSEDFMDLKEQYNKMLLDTILSYINRYNEEAGYTFIFERSRLSNLLIADEAHNITDAIIDGLNKEYDQWQAKKDEEDQPK